MTPLLLTSSGKPSTVLVNAEKIIGVLRREDETVVETVGDHYCVRETPLQIYAMITQGAPSAAAAEEPDEESSTDVTCPNCGEQDALQLLDAEAGTFACDACNHEWHEEGDWT